MLIFVLLCTFTISKNIAKAAYPRASLGCHWADKNATIEFYNNIGAFYEETEDAVATWNEVTDYRTGEPIVPMSLTDDFSCPNKLASIHLGTESRVLGKADIWSNTQTGEIEHVVIYINRDKPIHNAPGTWYTDYYDAQSVILHELGHAIGIAHCHEEVEGQEVKCYSQTCAINAMRPTLDLNTQRRTLAEYDIASKQLIYYY